MSAATFEGSYMEEEYMAELELDFCIAANMMLGMDFEAASEEAMEWVKEAHSSDD